MKGELAALQRRVQAAILGQEEGEWPGLQVYHNAYRLRLTEALAVEYPALARWLGEASFSRLALDYMAEFPSRHFSLRWVGERFPRFLERLGFHPWAEMAHFERALSLAFDCADAEPLTAAALARIPARDWPGLRFRFHPSVQLLSLRHPVVQVWKALQSGTAVPDCEPRGVPMPWLVWRCGLRQFFRSLDGAEAEALAALRNGVDFAGVCGALAGRELSTDAAHQAALWLRQWLEKGLIVAVNGS